MSDLKVGDEIFFSSNEPINYFSSYENFPDNPFMNEEMHRVLNKYKKFYVVSIHQNGNYIDIISSIGRCAFGWTFDKRWFSPTKKIKYVDDNII